MKNVKRYIASLCYRLAIFLDDRPYTGLYIRHEQQIENLKEETRYYVLRDSEIQYLKDLDDVERTNAITGLMRSILGSNIANKDTMSNVRIHDITPMYNGIRLEFRYRTLAMFEEAPDPETILKIAYTFPTKVGNEILKYV